MTYLDNAAAAPVPERALEIFRRHSLETFANQEGAGGASLEAARRVSEAGRALALALTGDKLAGVFWCNTGTDALSAAVSACPSLRQGPAVSTAGEHPALDSALERLSSGGVSVAKARLKADGRIDLDHLSSLLDGRTALVAVHHVQAETGATQDLVGIRGVMDRLAPKALLLADTTQSACKLRIPWDEARIDFATVSGQKIGCPGGAALLFRDTRARVAERRFDSLRRKSHLFGRCPSAVCLTLAELAGLLAGNLEERKSRASMIRAAFKSGVMEALGEKLRLTIPDGVASPYILHLITPGFQGAVLTRMLSDAGFSVAPGSACEAETSAPSKLLLAMGLRREDAYCALRLSFWDSSTESEAEPFAKALSSCLSSY